MEGGDVGIEGWTSWDCPKPGSWMVGEENRKGTCGLRARHMGDPLSQMGKLRHTETSWAALCLGYT